MHNEMGVVYSDVKKSVDAVIKFVGRDIKFAMTLGLSKPSVFINELYRRAKEDSTIKLTIVTALSLERPVGKSELEKRLVDPIAARVFKGVPEFQYMLDFRAGVMPKNIEVYEFYSKAGANMSAPALQQNHLNSNYTHVVRDAMDFGCNVFGQLLGSRVVEGKPLYSMGSNTDICIEAHKGLAKMRAEGKKAVSIGEVNPQMPFMYGDAVCEAGIFDILLEGPAFDNPLFGPPQEAIALKDHAIGLYASTLVKDGGTLQVGIGALGAAVGAALRMRHVNNAAYREVLRDSEIGIATRYKSIIDKLGGVAPFTEGLYGSSEMFVDVFLQLYKCGVLRRRVYENVAIMKLVNAGKIVAVNTGEMLVHEIPKNILELLVENEGIQEVLREKDIQMLVKFGILADGIEYAKDIDLRKPEYLRDLKLHLGVNLKGGQVILGAFYLGPRAFYATLNAMSEGERMQFGMSGVEKVNQLYGGEELRALQRKDGRFVNTGMVANVFGALASDALEDGRVVSGIGGQYNFVSMAHALPDARCIMMVRSTKLVNGKVKSSIVYNYGHCSIPKHLRDILVTEYGIADLRGKPDSKVIEEVLKVTDSRFQDELIHEAKLHGKLPKDFVLAAEFRRNTPQGVDVMLKKYQKDGHFVAFPFGTDLLPEEIVLGGALKSFKIKKPLALALALLAEMFKGIPVQAAPYLKRMGLDKPHTMKERLMRKMVLAALRASGKI